MLSVIQELAGEDVILDHTHVQGRVEDWKRRLSSLYSEIVAWFPDLRSDQSDTVEMYEDLMREYGVSPTRVPVLRLFEQHDQVAKFVPRGLWIIGANGRVDLFTPKGHFLIFDRSEYSEPSRWEIASSLRRLEPEPLTPDTLLRALS